MDFSVKMTSALNGYRRCSLQGCNNHGSHNKKGVRLFYFALPNDVKRRQLWLQFLQDVQSDVASGKNFVQKCVCSDHFNKDSIKRVNSNVLTLKADAIPSLSTGNYIFPLSDLPLADNLVSANERSQQTNDAIAQLIPEPTFSELIIQALTCTIEHMQHEINEVKVELKRSEILLARCRPSISE